MKITIDVSNFSDYTRVCLAEELKDADSLRALSKVGGDLNVRLALAENDHTPADVLDKLSDDEDAEVRYWVVENANTTKNTIIKLAEDKNSEVRKKAREKLN